MNEINKQLVLPEIEEKFLDKFPENWRPWPAYWSFTEKELQEKLADNTYKLLTLDISICDDDYVAKVNKGFTEKEVLAPEDIKELTRRAITYYVCDVGCKYCYEKMTKTENSLMDTKEIFAMLLEAKKLGLKSVKFLGPGELMHNPKLFEILDFLKENDIKIGIFTRGLVFGDDEYAQKIFGLSAKELCRKIAAYKNMAILFSFTSADKKTEEDRTQSKKVADLFEKRNRALENLAETGLNDDPDCQRLALIYAPILRDNIDEVFRIYKWALKRNIPMVAAPTMLSGKGKQMAEITDADFKEKDLVKLYVEIYRWLIKEKILSLTQIEQEGISPYPGFACNQFISGMLIRKDGRVQACPGNESQAFIYEKDVRKGNLREIWRNSLGYKLRDDLIKSGKLTVTQPCYAKSEETAQRDGEYLVNKGCGSIPAGFYETVLGKIKETLNS